MADVELPFRAEYSKSARASCKRCKEKIGKDVLRLAVMIQSPVFDGKFPNWFHFKCFFGPRRKIQSTAQFEGFDTLRWDDQKKLEKMIAGGGGDSVDGSASTSGGGDKNNTSADGVKKTAKGRKKKDDLGDFCTEYAKSSRSTCRGCENKIEKGQVRIAKYDFESERAVMYGPQPLWYHTDCFGKDREELEFFDAAETLPGFYTLGADDREMLKSKLKKINGKRKNESTTDQHISKKQKKEMEVEETKLQSQNKIFFKYRDQLKKLVDKKELVELLEYNEQDIPSGESRILDALADCMTFGALKKCQECNGGQLVYKSDGYHCTGHLTSWTQCLFVTKKPERVPYKVPEEFHQYDFLKKYKYVQRDRQLSSKVIAALTSASNTEKPLNNLKIAVLGGLSKSKEELKKSIEGLGGTLTSKLSGGVNLVISTKASLKKKTKHLTEAEESNIPVVSEEFLDNVKPGNLEATINKYNISPWEIDVKKIQKMESKSVGKPLKSTASGYTKGLPDKLKLTVKGAAAVDPESGLANSSHVLEEKGSLYNAVLGLVNIMKGTNSYYKLQLLEDDKHRNYSIFRSWGRVGTTIGGTKVETFDTKPEAVMEFKRLYEEKTGNTWAKRNEFVKQPGLFYPLDIDYGQDKEPEKIEALKPTSDCKLPKAVQELICLIFDVELMKKTMLEFEIDLKKMPLGKLSRKQIESAYSVLTEVQELIKTDGNATKLLDASNRFYTLIPHDFGMKKPPILDNEEEIKSKIEMLDSLLEIEVAYKLLQDVGKDSGESQLDKHYKQLKTDVEVLEKKSEEFELIQKYITNTHAPTHNQYSLHLEEVFKISRQGESKRYKPFRKLHNRQLLWHGSRLSNFAGILSQGLRIAPPEAPVTGYMFGKGIYFADVVSKSANYCYTSKTSPTGLLLLCEVALGNMYERMNADYITKLPSSMHSTKGVGMNVPDSTKAVKTPDGVEIPMGTLSTSKNRGSLLYNEYIVYDAAQVNIKYLLKVNFKWKF